MLESGEFGTIAEPAEREGIAPSYMTRVLRLTLLAPEIVEAIPDGRQGAAVTLARFMEPFPVSWNAQKNTSRHLTASLRTSRATAAVASWANLAKIADSTAGIAL